MDLLQSVRKEGSRGGVDFKWDDVKNSNHRENYLGHSLMAPVGRWQKGRDLNWYANGADGAQATEEEEAQRRKDELRKVKEAEEDAMARALGLPVPDRSANTEPLGERPALGADINAAKEDREPTDSRSARHKDKRDGHRRHHRHHSAERRRRRSRSYSPRPKHRANDVRPRKRDSRSRSRSPRRYRSRSRDKPTRRQSRERDRSIRRDAHDSRRDRARSRSRSPNRSMHRDRRRHHDDRRASNG